MKPYELMIGDWVTTPFVPFLGKNLTERVEYLESSAIAENCKRLIAVKLSGTFLEMDSSNVRVEPVRIEPEMFQLNGFGNYPDLDGVACYLHEDPYNHGELQAYKEGDFWRFRIQRGPEASVSIRARYVHELQHAMRLMGLHDMANNFKIKEGGNQ